MVQFSDLQAGDLFLAHTGTFQKLSATRTKELSDANAINTTTHQLAFFGPTVPVEFVQHERINVNLGHLTRKLMIGLMV